MNKNSDPKQAQGSVITAPPRAGMSIQSLSKQAHLALLSDNALPFSSFVSSDVVVQNYPEKYVRPSAGCPRANDKSYNDAQAKGFVYGIMADNTGQHWTRLIMVKPSEQLATLWNERIGGKIEAIVFRHQSYDPTYVRVSATSAQGINHTLLGFMSANEYNKLKESAWQAELGQSATGNASND